mgnify:FL=1
MFWTIIIILTASAEVSIDITPDYKFDTEIKCQNYIIENYDDLNANVNQEYNQHPSTPNLYRCVRGGNRT